MAYTNLSDQQHESMQLELEPYLGLWVQLPDWYFEHSYLSGEEGTEVAPSPIYPTGCQRGVFLKYMFIMLLPDQRFLAPHLISSFEHLLEFQAPFKLCIHISNFLQTSALSPYLLGGVLASGAPGTVLSSVTVT